jgi:hypothetical protein
VTVRLDSTLILLTILASASDASSPAIQIHWASNWMSCGIMRNVGDSPIEIAHSIPSHPVRVLSVRLSCHLNSANCCISTVLKPSKGVSPITSRSVRGPNIFSCRICVSLMYHVSYRLLGRKDAEIADRMHSSLGTQSTQREEERPVRYLPFWCMESILSWRRCVFRCPGEPVGFGRVTVTHPTCIEYVAACDGMENEMQDKAESHIGARIQNQMMRIEGVAERATSRHPPHSALTGSLSSIAVMSIRSCDEVPLRIDTFLAVFRRAEMRSMRGKSVQEVKTMMS